MFQQFLKSVSIRYVVRVATEKQQNQWYHYINNITKSVILLKSVNQ